MCEPFHIDIIYSQSGNVKSRGMPCERQRHAERRDQILTDNSNCTIIVVLT